MFGSSSARQQMHEDAATSFAQPDKSRHRRGNTEDVKILIEYVVRQREVAALLREQHD